MNRAERIKNGERIQDALREQIKKNYVKQFRQESSDYKRQQFGADPLDSYDMIQKEMVKNHKNSLSDNKEFIDLLKERTQGKDEGIISNKVVSEVQGMRQETIVTTPFDSRDTHIYYNINLINTTLNVELPAKVYDTRSQPILKKADDYFISVVRFSLPASGIPLFNANVDGSGNIVNWFITMEDASGNTYKAPVPYIYENSSSFTYVFSYQQIADMINTAFQAAYVLLVAAHSGIVPSAPFMIYDAVTELYSIIAPKEYQTAGIGVWMSSQIYKKFNNFEVFFNDFNTPSGLDVELLFENHGNNTLDASGNQLGFNPSGTGAAYYVNTQEYPALFNINEFKSIVFLTGSIPILAESIPSASISGNSNSGAGSATNTTLSILTDFELNASAISTARSQIQYYPQGAYRLTEMIGTSPLNSIDMQIYYQDLQNNIFPLFLEPSEYATVKIMFRKKTMGV